MIIVLCGLKGSGKDTIANYLVKYHNFIKFAFATAVKDICSILFGWPRHLLEGDTADSRLFRETEDEWWTRKLGFKLTPRIALQKIGTDVFRDHFHKDIWTLIIENKINASLNSNKNIVITDARFQNELAMLKKYGSKIIYVNRALPSWFTPYKNYEIESPPENIHISEYDWIRTDFDYKINNTGSYNNLYENIEMFFKNKNT